MLEEEETRFEALRVAFLRPRSSPELRRLPALSFKERLPEKLS